jgi:cation:H+ antiporter
VILVWPVGLIAGLVLATFASRRAVFAALRASEVSRLSPAFIGVTVMAVGTDLPEITNSVIAALTGHGDVNVGDSAGSALTQVTFVLAIVCFAASTVRSPRRVAATLGVATFAALLLDGFLIRDRVFGRLDGLLVVSIWLVSLVVLDQLRSDPPDVEPPDRRSAAPYFVRAILWLAIVGVSATIVVRSFTELTDVVGVPELVASAVVLALGTSLPELVVDLTAIRRGAIALALGDLFGSSFVDATLAIGSGPAIRATAVSADATTACVIAAVGVVLAAILMASRSTHGRYSALALFGIYGVSMTAMIGLTG